MCDMTNEKLIKTRSLQVLAFVSIFIGPSFHTHADEPQYKERALHMRTTAPQQYIHDATFLVETSIGTNINYVPHGSGFRVAYDNIVYGVTARHVVQNLNPNDNSWSGFTTPIYIRARSSSTNEANKNGHKDLSQLGPPEQIYHFHTNSHVDVAVFPMVSDIKFAEIMAAIPFNMLQNNEDILPGEDVHIFGYPGPYGFDSGESVIRSGTICYKNDKYTYLLDANLWPGDSGGLICSKPYFGVPAENKSQYQWHFGGKILGLETAYVSPQVFATIFSNLPKELQGFKIVISSQAIKEVFESESFQREHAKIKKSLYKDPVR